MKHIELWGQKKLKIMHIIFLGLYFCVSFIAPIIYSITKISITTVTDTERHLKFPLIFIVVLAIVILAALSVLKKNITKIKVFNLDGTYNDGALWFRLIADFLAAAIIPIMVIIATALCYNKLAGMIDTISIQIIEDVPVYADKVKQLLNVYREFIIVNLVFYIAGMIINKIFVQTMEFEIDIRNKVSEANAIQRRVNNLENIK